MKIGMFDSGIGGLTLLYKGMQSLPEEEFVFYADTKNSPYGTKTKEEIQQLSDKAVQLLLAEGCDMIVIACNTATSVAAAMLREKYSIPILGIEPAVKPAVANSKHKRILVMATEVTVREKKLKDLIQQVDEEHLVDMVAMPEFVTFAEQGIFEGEPIVQYIRDQLREYPLEAYGEVVIGCTHFNHFIPEIQKVFPNPIEIMDGSDGTIRHLVHLAKSLKLPSANGGRVRYYLSGEPITDSATIDFYNRVMEHLAHLVGVC